MADLINLNFNLKDIFKKPKSKSELHGLLNMPQKVYLQKTRGAKTERFFDSDKDRVINGLDCFPFDKNRHRTSIPSLDGQEPTVKMDMPSLFGSQITPSAGFQAISGKQPAISMPRQNLRAFDGMARPQQIPQIPSNMQAMPPLRPQQLLQEQQQRRIMRADASGSAYANPTQVGGTD